MEGTTDNGDAAYVTRVPAPAIVSTCGVPAAPWGRGGTCAAEARTSGATAAYVAIVSGLSMWALACG